MCRRSLPTPVAAAAVLVCASRDFIQDLSNTGKQPNLAQQIPSALTVSSLSGEKSDWSLAKPIATRDFSFPLRRNFRVSAHAQRAAATPRYVLDSTPGSYEPAFNF